MQWPQATWTKFFYSSRRRSIPIGIHSQQSFCLSVNCVTLDFRALCGFADKVWQASNSSDTGFDLNTYANLITHPTQTMVTTTTATRSGFESNGNNQQSRRSPVFRSPIFFGHPQSLFLLLYVNLFTFCCPRRWRWSPPPRLWLRLTRGAGESYQSFQANKLTRSSWSSSRAWLLSLSALVSRVSVLWVFAPTILDYLVWLIECVHFTLANCRAMVIIESVKVCHRTDHPPKVYLWKWSSLAAPFIHPPPSTPSQH